MRTFLAMIMLLSGIGAALAGASALVENDDLQREPVVTSSRSMPVATSKPDARFER